MDSFRATLAALVGGTLHSGELRAAPGDLDLSFSGTGKVITAVTESHDLGASVLVQDNGKIVVAGVSIAYGGMFALVRYNPDGTLDTSFNGTGKVTTPANSFDGGSAALQKDGKVVVAGTSYAITGDDFAVIRYNPDGTLDTTFNGTGKVTTAVASGNGTDSASALALQSDGRILVAGKSSVGGHFDFALVRYNSDGSLDTTFNGTGIVTTDLGSDDEGAADLVIQNDGKIVVAGSSGLYP